MKKAIHAAILAGGITLSGIALAHPPVTLTPQGQQVVVEEIIEFRKKLAAAIAAKDVAFLRKSYAESFSHTHTSQKWMGRMRGLSRRLR